MLITIHGITYDMENFAQKHPGGNIILHYIDQDATEAFDTFHAHSKNAYNILKRLPVVSQAKAIDEVVDYSNDFTHQTNVLRDKGFFKPNYMHWIIRFVELIAWFVSGYYLMLMGGLWALISLVPLLVFNLRLVTLSHDAGHNTIMATKMDKNIHHIANALLLIFTNNCLIEIHNKHHSGANVQKNIWGIQFQYNPKLYALGMSRLWIHVILGRIAVGWLFAFGSYLLLEVIAIVALLLQLTHFKWKFFEGDCGSEILKGTWIGRALDKNNFGANKLMGHLISHQNYQIEHHLWPSMMPFNYPRIANVISDKPYNEWLTNEKIDK